MFMAMRGTRRALKRIEGKRMFIALARLVIMRCKLFLNRRIDGITREKLDFLRRARAGKVEICVWMYYICTRICMKRIVRACLIMFDMHPLSFILHSENSQ